MGRDRGARDLMHSRAGCQGWQGRSERARRGAGPAPGTPSGAARGRERDLT